MPLLPVLVCALCLPALADDRLIVVDDGPFPGDFTTIQEAVDAALDGDVILVRPGTYTGFTIDGKGVSVVAEKPDDMRLDTVFKRVEVSNLAPGQTVNIRGLYLRMFHQGQWDETHIAVNLHDNAGTVLLEDCRVLSSGSYELVPLGPALRVRNCAAAFAVRSTLLGGVRAESSNVLLYGCDLSSADGVDCNFGVASKPGRPALRIVGGTVLLHGCSVHGGAGGGNPASLVGCCAWQGGPAVELLQGSPTLWILDSKLDAGAFGEGVPCASAMQPDDIEIATGEVVQLPGSARDLRAAPVSAAGATVRFDVAGEPLDLALLGWSASAAPIPLFAYGGWLLPDPAALHTLPLGVLSTGTLALDLPVPSLPPSLAGLRLYSQAAFVGSDASVVLGAPSALALLELQAAVDPLGGDDCDGDGTSDLWDIVVQGERDDDLDLAPNGCDEFARLFVDDDASQDPGPGNPGLSDPLEDGSPVHPFDAIQEALDAAEVEPYHVVLVAPGTYTGAGNRNLSFGAKDLALRGVGGPTACVIDCQGLARGFLLDKALTYRSRIEGLTIRGGVAENGAGAYLEGADTVFVDCVFEDNHADHWIFSDGGGVYVLDGTPAFLRCTFRGNTSAGRGGGVHVADDLSFAGDYPDDVTFEDCRFEDNASTGGEGGGGLSSALSVGRLQVRRTTFVGNFASKNGGGLLSTGSAALPQALGVESCSFIGNRADQRGGGLATMPWSGASVRGSTFTGNSAGVRGGALDHASSYQALAIASSILWDDALDVPGPGAELGSDGALELASCDLQGGIVGILLAGAGAVLGGSGMLDVDPLFLAPGTGDHHLAPGSPCIDAGAPDDVPGIFERDLDGDPRRIGAAVDVGADEVTP